MASAPPQAASQIRDFGGYCWVPDLPETIIAANEMRKRFERQGRIDAAEMVVIAVAEFRRNLLVLGQQMAKDGTSTLRAWEKATRVRPDTHGGGGKRLGDYLVCEPVVPTILPGTIGINNEKLLDDNVPWWVTNEIGSSTQIGRRIFGVFFEPGDDSPPNQDEFREHALFAPAPYRAGGGPGTIEHGIPARGFIHKAAAAIEKAWMAEFTAIKATFNAAIDRAIVTYR